MHSDKVTTGCSISIKQETMGFITGETIQLTTLLQWDKNNHCEAKLLILM